MNSENSEVPFDWLEGPAAVVIHCLRVSKGNCSSVILSRAVALLRLLVNVEVHVGSALNQQHVCRVSFGSIKTHRRT